MLFRSEQIVCQHMDLQVVCIDDHSGTADSGKVKAAFSFFDEIFHFTASAVKSDHLIRRQFFHCSNNEGVSVDYRFFLNFGYFISADDSGLVGNLMFQQN